MRWANLYSNRRGLRGRIIFARRRPDTDAYGYRDTHAYGLNAVGLERRGFSKERIRKIHHAYKVLLASKLNTSQALEKLQSEKDRGEDVDLLIRFIKASERGVIK